MENDALCDEINTKILYLIRVFDIGYVKLEQRIHLYIVGKGGGEAYNIKIWKQETECRDIVEEGIY